MVGLLGKQGFSCYVGTYGKLGLEGFPRSQAPAIGEFKVCRRRGILVMERRE